MRLASWLRIKNTLKTIVLCMYWCLQFIWCIFGTLFFLSWYLFFLSRCLLLFFCLLENTCAGLDRTNFSYLCLDQPITFYRFWADFFLCARQHETFYKTFPTYKKCLCKSEFPFGTTSILIVDWYKSIPIPNHLNIYATTWRSAPQYLPPALPLD